MGEYKNEYPMAKIKFNQRRAEIYLRCELLQEHQQIIISFLQYAVVSCKMKHNLTRSNLFLNYINYITNKHILEGKNYHHATLLFIN